VFAMERRKRGVRRTPLTESKACVGTRKLALGTGRGKKGRKFNKIHLGEVPD